VPNCPLGKARLRASRLVRVWPAERHAENDHRSRGQTEFLSHEVWFVAKGAQVTSAETQSGCRDHGVLRGDGRIDCANQSAFEVLVRDAGLARPLSDLAVSCPVGDKEQNYRCVR